MEVSTQWVSRQSTPTTVQDRRSTDWMLWYSSDA